MNRLFAALISAGALAATASYSPLPAAAPPSRPAPAKEAKDTKSDPANKAVDPLAITASGDAMNRVGRPVFVTTNIKNVSGDDLLVENLSIDIDSGSADRFVTKHCGLQQLGEITIVRGLSFEQSCRFEMKAPEFSFSLKDWQDILLATDVRLAVTVKVNGLGEYRYYPTISIKAQEFSIFLGGVLGAFLLAIFVWIQRMLTHPEVREQWIKNLFFALLMAFRGGIMAVIALLLGKTTQGTGSPVSLTVVDFAGGIMIGLFSYPLASWISSALKLDDAYVAIKKTRGVPEKPGPIVPAAHSKDG